MRKYILYKITRDDGQVYIGTTYTDKEGYNDGFKRRITSHKKSDKFKNHQIYVDIIEESTDYNYIQLQETFYVKYFDSYHNGLNESFDGKGGHLHGNFTTRGFKYSDSSRKKMSDSAKLRIARDGNGFKGKKHTDEFKERMSRARAGIRRTSKLQKDDVIKLLDLYYSHPEIEGVGVVRRNGLKMSYDQAFSIKYCGDFGITKECVNLIIKGKSWKDVERK